MDPEAVMERADVSRQDDLVPNSTEGETWVAVDPETGCRGIGAFEGDARSNLVFAVRAYRNREGSVPLMSSGEGETVEMRWLRERRSLADRLRDWLPF